MSSSRSPESLLTQPGASWTCGCPRCPIRELSCRNLALLRRSSVDPQVSPGLVRGSVSKHRTPQNGNLLFMSPPTSLSVKLRHGFSACIVRVLPCSSVRRGPKLLPQSPNKATPDYVARSSEVPWRCLKLLIRWFLRSLLNFPRTRKQREEAKTLRSRIRQPLPLPLTRADGICGRF